VSLFNYPQNIVSIVLDLITSGKKIST